MSGPAKAVEKQAKSVDVRFAVLRPVFDDTPVLMSTDFNNLDESEVLEGRVGIGV